MRWVECQIEIGTGPDRILQAFTDETMLRHWWSVEKSMIELKAEGNYTLAWGISAEGIKYISTGQITSYEPSRHLRIDNYLYISFDQPVLGPVTLDISVARNDGYCLLSLQQGPYPEGRGDDWEWYYDAVKQAWPGVLQQLKKYLEDGI